MLSWRAQCWDEVPVQQAEWVLVGGMLRTGAVHLKPLIDTPARHARDIFSSSLELKKLVEIWEKLGLTLLMPTTVKCLVLIVFTNRTVCMYTPL